MGEFGGSGGIKVSAFAHEDEGLMLSGSMAQVSATRIQTPART